MYICDDDKMCWRKLWFDYYDECKLWFNHKEFLLMFNEFMLIMIMIIYVQNPAADTHLNSPFWKNQYTTTKICGFFHFYLFLYFLLYFFLFFLGSFLNISSSSFSFCNVFGLKMRKGYFFLFGFAFIGFSDAVDG